MPKITFLDSVALKTWTLIKIWKSIFLGKCNTFSILRIAEKVKKRYMPFTFHTSRQNGKVGYHYFCLRQLCPVIFLFPFSTFTFLKQSFLIHTSLSYNLINCFANSLQMKQDFKFSLVYPELYSFKVRFSRNYSKAFNLMIYPYIRDCMISIMSFE